MPGSSRLPRVGTRRNPDRPSRGREAVELARILGVDLLDWQAHTLEVGLERAGERWAHRDVALIVGRQNGKTRVLLVRILAGLLLWSERILHSAQNRDLPREVFLEVAAILEDQIPELVLDVRRANGQESITLANGGRYKIVAPRQSSPRGLTGDLLILDEAREYRTSAFVAAIAPALNTSADPSTWWASNAGDADSIVLNGLRSRGLTGDPSLAWLEYSADPALDDDDPAAWAQSNPSLGSLIDLETIAHLQRTMTPEDFETEVLCRWVTVSGERAIPAALWSAAADPGLEGPAGPDGRLCLAVDVDPDRAAVAAVAAWSLDDGRIGTDLVFYSTSPATCGDDLEALVVELAPLVVGYDPWTTATLAATIGRRRKVEPVTGRGWVAACGRLLELLDSDRLRHPDRAALARQLDQAHRRTTVEGRWWITRGAEPIPAVTATARAVYLASRPRRIGAVHGAADVDA